MQVNPDDGARDNFGKFINQFQHETKTIMHIYIYIYTFMYSHVHFGAKR